MIAHGTLEANIVRHCNNHCTNCSHASPWAKHYFMPPEVLARDLMILRQFMDIHQFWLLGGEPLLHPQILEMLDVARNSRIAPEIGVLTNATILNRMPEEFFQKINLLRISAYPKLDAKILDFAEAKSKEYKFWMGIDRISLFWKQFKVGDPDEHFRACPWKSACWTVHDGHFYLCPNAAFWPEHILHLDPHLDGLDITNNLTEEQLKAYIERTNGFKTCAICSPFVQQEQWSESATFTEWLEKSRVTI